MGDVLADLRRSLAAIEAGPGAGLAAPRRRFGADGLRDVRDRPAPEAADEPPPSFGLGMAAIDARVGPMPVGALHEIRAASQNDGPAAGGFAVALMLRALAAAPRPGRAVIVRQSMTAAEFGEMHGAGLLALGADPGELLLARVRDGLGCLQAGLEALRSPGIGAVAIEIWGDPPALDLDATRRLSVAARRSGAAALLLRVAAREGEPSAAHVRWRVRAGRSTPLAAGAPGHPVFEIELLRHRAGLPQQAWRVEWSRETRTFRDPSIPVPLAAVPPHRSPASDLGGAGRDGLRRVG